MTEFWSFSNMKTILGTSGRFLKGVVKIGNMVMTNQNKEYFVKGNLPKVIHIHKKPFHVHK